MIVYNCTISTYISVQFTRVPLLRGNAHSLINTDTGLCAES